MTRIVLGFTGDVTTTAAIPWLKETEGAEVVAVLVDRFDARELEAVRDRALAAGAVRAHVIEVQSVFAREFLRPALRAGALQTEAIVASLAAPMVARTLVEIAGIEQADAIAHGAHGAGASRLRAAIEALKPAATVIAVAEKWSMAHAAQLEYARIRGVLVSAPDADEHAAEGAVSSTSQRFPARPDAEPVHVDITFDRGVPVALNGIELPLQDLVATLGTIAGAVGVTRAPAIVLDLAHSALAALVESDAATSAFATQLADAYARLVETGGWFTPLRNALDAAVDVLQDELTGIVRLSMRDGAVETSARPADRPVLLRMASR